MTSEDTDGSRKAAVANLFVREWGVPWHAHLVPLVLTGILIGAWLKFSEAGQMAGWAVSWTALQQGRSATIILHIFAHGGWAHLLMNAAALLLLSGPLVSRFGRPPLAWARYLYLFVGSGLAGAAAFLAFNQGAAVLGASGAIFGLLGTLGRIHPATGEVVPIRSPRTWALAKFFLQNHLALFALLALVAIFTGQGALLSWEAHLGGLLFGFFVAPLFLWKRSAQ